MSSPQKKQESKMIKLKNQSLKSSIQKYPCSGNESSK